MRLGVISDTHGKLRAEVLPHFTGVAAILHAGDVGDPSILDHLAAVAPVHAVWGNTDDFGIRSRVPERQDLELAGTRVVVVHGHQLGAPKPVPLLAAFPEADVIVYGHTHRPLIEAIDGRLALNPGAAGPARFKLRPSIALLTLGSEGPTARLIEL